MATMEEIRNLASDAAQSAAKTARYIALVSKKRVEIAREQERIRRLYAKLGKVYYKDYVTDEEPDDAEYQPLCESISDSFRRINALREEIAAAKEEYCGEKAEANTQPEEEEKFDIVPLEAPETAEPEE